MRGRLPWWCICIGWFLVVSSNLLAAYLIILYGLTFGKERSNIIQLLQHTHKRISTKSYCLLENGYQPKYHGKRTTCDWFPVKLGPGWLGQYKCASQLNPSLPKRMPSPSLAYPKLINLQLTGTVAENILSYYSHASTPTLGLLKKHTCQPNHRGVWIHSTTSFAR